MFLGVAQRFLGQAVKHYGQGALGIAPGVGQADAVGHGYPGPGLKIRQQLPEHGPQA